MNPSESARSNLMRTVVDGGYCIGCAACTAVRDSPFEIRTNERGQYAAAETGAVDPASSAASRAEAVCPFGGGAPNEDAIGLERFGAQAEYDKHIGHHIGRYAGYVKEGDFRRRGSSGGFGKWILYELLTNGLVDAVIQVAEREPGDDDDKVFGFTVMHSPGDVLDGSRSAYYPVEMSGALEYIREHPGRYAITGIPCFVKALRLLSRSEPVFEERIVFCVGVICGHLKSSWYADMVAWQLGVKPGRLAGIDFREKLPEATAKQKGISVSSKDDSSEVEGPAIAQNLFGTDYNLGLFQYRACDYCDDVVAETADVSVGDAWLPEYIPDGRGTSLIITRNRLIHDLIHRAKEDGRIHLDEISTEQVVSSQIGGFRQRREGLAYRLHLADQSGRWRPNKRVDPSRRHISRRRRAIYDMRMVLAERSYELFERAVRDNDFELFRHAMQSVIDDYRSLYRLTWPERIRKGIARRWKRWTRRRAGGEGT